MKQRKSEQKPGKLQKSIAECGNRHVRLSHTSNKKLLWMLELKESVGKRRLQRNADEFRRKTRSQALSEKQAKEAVSSSLTFSEVSIETLHSICAPAALQQANKSLQKQTTNESTSRSTDQLEKFGFAPYGLLLSSKQNLFHTFQSCSPEENGLKDENHNKRPEIEKPPHSSHVVDNMPLEDRWLEVFVEIDDGINLVVDLDSSSIAEWFMERNSSTLLYADMADETHNQCGTDSHPNDHPESACFGSNDIEALTTYTTAHNDKLTTFCTVGDGDAGSQTAQMGLSDGCLPSCKLAEVIDSQESFNSEVKGPGFNFDCLDRMPTYFATDLRRPSAEDSKVTCNSKWMVSCIGA